MAISQLRLVKMILNRFFPWEPPSKYSPRHWEIDRDTPEPMNNLRPKMPSVKGIGTLRTLMMVQMPDVISAADTAYCSRAGQNGKRPQTVNLMTTSGGVINPPTMAKACCSPIMRAMKRGIGSSSRDKDQCRVRC